jgi:hypothetical protein
MDSTSYNSAYGDSGTSQALDPAVTAALVIGTLILVLIAYVVSSLLLGMIFKKANVPVWKAWVPVYNQWVFLELGDQKGWLALLPLLYVIPFVGWFFLGPVASLVTFVFSCIAAYRIGLNFGKEGVFVLLYIFLSLVWFIWLAVDKTAVWKPGASGSGSAPTSMPPQDSAGPNQPAAM